MWVDDKKIGSIGVAISGGFTRHGVAFNAAPDISAFDKIIACGDPISKATSLEKELDKSVDLDQVASSLAQNILACIGYKGSIQKIPDVNTLCKTHALSEASQN